MRRENAAGQNSAASRPGWIVACFLAAAAACILVAAAALILGGYYALSRDDGTTREPTQSAISEPAAEETPLATLPPSLAGVAFPTQVIDYPPDWPADLRYPQDFKPVETSSGPLAQGVEGWSAKLLYTGDTREASDLIVSSFQANGWLVVEMAELDSEKRVLALEEVESGGSAVIAIEPDEDRSGLIRVIVTVLR